MADPLVDAGVKITRGWSANRIGRAQVIGLTDGEQVDVVSCRASSRKPAAAFAPP